MGWPQVLLMSLWAIGLGIHIALHGKPMRGTFNGWSKAIGLAIWCSLLWWGGFFSHG